MLCEGSRYEHLDWGGGEEQLSSFKNFGELGGLMRIIDNFGRGKVVKSQSREV